VSKADATHRCHAEVPRWSSPPVSRSPSGRVRRARFGLGTSSIALHGPYPASAAPSGRPPTKVAPMRLSIGWWRCLRMQCAMQKIQRRGRGPRGTLGIPCGRTSSCVQRCVRFRLKCCSVSPGCGGSRRTASRVVRAAWRSSWAGSSWVRVDPLWRPAQHAVVSNGVSNRPRIPDGKPNRAGIIFRVSGVRVPPPAS
jgi:hypothetical protein